MNIDVWGIYSSLKNECEYAIARQKKCFFFHSLSLSPLSIIQQYSVIVIWICYGQSETGSWQSLWSHFFPTLLLWHLDVYLMMDFSFFLRQFFFYYFSLILHIRYTHTPTPKMDKYCWFILISWIFNLFVRYCIGIYMCGCFLVRILL